MQNPTLALRASDAFGMACPPVSHGTPKRREKLRTITVTLSLTAVIFSMAATVALAQGAAPQYPGVIKFPAGFGPEGIAIGNGSTFYAGAAIGSDEALLGQILTGDLRTGKFSELVRPSGMHALGMKLVSPSNLLFVAGGPSGTGRVYDATSGVQVALYQFKPAAPLSGPFTTLINDVVITRNAAYFTDSAGCSGPPGCTPNLYRVELGFRGEPAASFDPIPLPSEFGAGVFGSCGPAARANGIVADPTGKYLIIANSSRGELYRMDTATHTIVPIKVDGGTLCNADGLVLDGKTLYVVSKKQAADAVSNQVAVVELAPDYLSGTLTRGITEPFESNPATKAPASIADYGNWLYAVTGGFAPPAPDYLVCIPKAINVPCPSAGPFLTASPNAIPVTGDAVHGSTTLSWNAPNADVVDIRIGAPDGPSIGRHGPFGTTSTGVWVSDGMTFYLQDVTGGKPLTSDNTLARLVVRLQRN